jgi:hypothetical protein
VFRLFSLKKINMKKTIIFSLLLLSVVCQAQNRKTENVVVITFDGFRWQEMFGGADSVLINDLTYVRDTGSLRKKFWASTAIERREKLLPFIWNEMGRNGQLYGNRQYGNKVNNANKYWFSYPGYNEIFTGFPDDSVNSNDKNLNKNINVLEFINKQPAYKGKVAAFTSWDCFDAIFNEPRAGFLVSSGFDKVNIQTPEFKLLNEMQFNSPQPLGESVRPDFLTYHFAKEYVKKYQPRVLYIGFDETDDYAHEGKYDHYLYAAYMTDKWIGDLWNFMQSIPQYKGKTTFILTTDHGRGDKDKKQWKDHGQKVPDASEMWMAIIGPDAKPIGEVKTDIQLFQRQVATTIAALLGLKFNPNHPVMDPVAIK